MEDLDLNGKTHRVELEVDNVRGNIYTTLHDRPESSIASIEQSPDDGPQDFEYRVDMASIMVDRCNAYPATVAALRRVSEFLEANYSDSDMPDILPMVRDALAKAVK